MVQNCPMPSLWLSWKKSDHIDFFSNYDLIRILCDQKTFPSGTVLKNRKRKLLTSSENLPKRSNGCEEKWEKGTFCSCSLPWPTTRLWCSWAASTTQAGSWPNKTYLSLILIGNNQYLTTTKHREGQLPVVCQPMAAKKTQWVNFHLSSNELIQCVSFLQRGRVNMMDLSPELNVLKLISKF